MTLPWNRQVDAKTGLSPPRLGGQPDSGQPSRGGDSDLRAREVLGSSLPDSIGED